MPTKVLVSDTNIWIDLYRGGLLESVFELPYEFVTTEFAWGELRRPPGADLVALGLSVEVLPGEAAIEIYELRATLRNPSLADVSCYYLAASQGWTLLTGDKAVRRACRAENMEVRGTLWLMDELYERRVVAGSILCQALKKMLEAGGRLPEKECKERLLRWEQSE
ncbi:MAG: type II toxin-antitoxin system VapC family toxin [Pseudomonadota bacterium]